MTEKVEPAELGAEKGEGMQELGSRNKAASWQETKLWGKKYILAC